MTSTPDATAMVLSDGDISTILSLARDTAGLVFSDAKRELIEPRVLRGLRRDGIDDVRAFLDRAKRDDGKERRRLIATLTTNHTAFFREEHHYRDLAHNVCPVLADRGDDGPPIRLWSAGCANGAEAYSAAITLTKYLPGLRMRDCRILATDIDPYCVEEARKGLYSSKMTAPLLEQDVGRFFSRIDDRTGLVRIAPELRNMVRARVLNMHDPWPMRGTFDAIFFRNVSIYFDQPTASRLWPRIVAAIRPGGTLYLGHTERLPETLTSVMEPVGQTTYRKRSGGVD